jgi:hypothetical protein
MTRTPDRQIWSPMSHTFGISGIPNVEWYVHAPSRAERVRALSHCAPNHARLAAIQGDRGFARSHARDVTKRGVGSAGSRGCWQAWRARVICSGQARATQCTGMGTSRQSGRCRLAICRLRHGAIMPLMGRSRISLKHYRASPPTS